MSSTCRYGHLKFKESPLALVVLASWGIAFVEYWLAVPANRWGSAVYSAAQLKTMQEVITLVVFAGFSVLYLKEPLGWNTDWVCLIAGGVPDLPQMRRERRFADARSFRGGATRKTRRICP
jgi:uncharacterized protein (DUF486 family)